MFTTAFILGILIGVTLSVAGLSALVMVNLKDQRAHYDRQR